MITTINDNVVFVSGANSGAIYDFNHNKIYSINNEANKFLLRIFSGGKADSIDEEKYLDKLEQEKLFFRNYSFCEYYPESRPIRKLNFAWLEVTQVCNLRCLHCYEGKEHQSSEIKLAVADWKRIIKELYEIGCSNIQFIGGEPSCYADIIELVKYAGNFDFNSIGFFTNSTNITDGLFECLIQNRVKVNVSLYGHNAGVHDSITQVKGSFDKTIANVKRMVENDIEVTIAVTIMRENETYYEDIVKFVKTLGVKHFKYDLVREVCNCSQDCHLSTRKDLIEKKYRTKPSFAISKEWFDNSFFINNCWYGKFAIAENGDVMPCVFEREIKYGNLKECSVQQLLDSELLNKHWYMDFSKIEECKDCEYRFACKDCRPLGLLNGGINKKNSRCLYHPISGEWK